MSQPADGALYVGEVVHRRTRPKRHQLRYGVFSMLADLDRLDELDRRLKLFSVGRFNLFSLVARDFAARDGSDLAEAIRVRASRTGIAEAARIEMLFYPRLFGFAFNPITTYYLYAADGSLCGMIYEVNNTFGEHRFYEAAVDEVAGQVSHNLPKALYVSPFNTHEGSYRFAVRRGDEAIFLGITLSDEDGPAAHRAFCRQAPGAERSRPAPPGNCLPLHDLEGRLRHLLGGLAHLAEGRSPHPAQP